MKDQNGNKKEFQYRPELLCVGKKIPLSYEVFFTEDESDRAVPWQKVQQEFLDKNPQIVTQIYEKNMMDTDKDKFFPVSVGSCKGDSGGPLFMKGQLTKYQFIHSPTKLESGQVNKQMTKTTALGATSIVQFNTKELEHHHNNNNTTQQLQQINTTFKKGNKVNKKIF